ncbi:gluconokinase [Nocardia takedensis]|uniref:gluconokinase n=1 Tax=Nocardia takedensis TaxID=259390 RepID=UPI0003131483|nr:gluconokinase [Nocardia takedensis]
MTGPQTPLVVVMGVSGTGKTTLGTRLARALGVEFAEGDDLHPRENIEKMSAGLALTDADRAPWLDRVAAWLADRGDSGGVVSCSALKRAYRDRLRVAAPTVFFAHPVADRAELRRRVRSRRDHFMPAALLDSQLADLEPLTADESGWTVDATADPDLLVEQVRAALRPGAE